MARATLPVTNGRKQVRWLLCYFSSASNDLVCVEATIQAWSSKLADALDVDNGMLMTGMAGDEALTVGVEPAASDQDASLAAGGDVEAFIRLYRAHLTPIYRYLYARLGRRGEAEDVTQQVFERAWSSVRSYKPVPGGSFRGWIFTIARRAAADHFRDMNRSRGHQTLEILADELVDPTLGPEEVATLADQVRSVLRIVSELPDEGREVITLRFIADLSYREIAAIMGKKEPAVKMAAYRALDVIRQRRRNSDV